MGTHWNTYTRYQFPLAILRKTPGVDISQISTKIKYRYLTHINWSITIPNLYELKQQRQAQTWPWVSVSPDWSRDHNNLGGGRVTRFPFGTLNVFVYISHWASRVNSQNRPHFEGDCRNWWLTRALLDAIQMAASRSNMMTYLCKIGTWYY